MDIGFPRENSTINAERRAIIQPKEVSKLIEAGHRVFIEKSLGKGIYISDEAYKKAGAKVVSSKKKVFQKELVVKIKPPLPQEFKLLNNNILFAMLHAEQNPHYVRALGERNAKAIAMELVRNRAGERQIQCSDISGEQGMIMAFQLAEKSPDECRVLVLGYGDVSSGALKIAHSLGSHVKILRKSEYRFIKEHLKNTDIVVNGIQWPKEKRLKREYLITREMLTLLNKGAVILDLSVDFPNPIEPCRPSPHRKPVYTVDGVRCLSIYGYPRLVPISSSKRYSKQVLPLILKIATNQLSKLPKSIKNAVIDPSVYKSLPEKRPAKQIVPADSLNEVLSNIV